MKRLASTLPNLVLSLTLITAVAGALLGVMYEVTKEPIAKMEREQQLDAIRAVAPSFNNDPETDAQVIELNGQQYTVYPALLNGKLQGAAVKSLSMNGFSGRIDIMVGFNADGSVKDYAVIKHAETPGLGSNMQEWFRNPTGFRSIIDKNPGKVNFYVVKDTENKGEIDGITAATISSRAFLEAVRNAYAAWLKYTGEESNIDTDSHSGATYRAGTSSEAASSSVATTGATSSVDSTSGATISNDATSGATTSDNQKEHRGKFKKKFKGHKKQLSKSE